MTSPVFHLSPEQETAIKNQLLPHAVPNKNPYATLVAKFKGATLTLYRSGKFMIQGPEAEQVAEELGLGHAESEKSPTSGSTAGQPANTLTLIGSDEVGNGSYFGGLAVVASLVKPEDHAWLKKLGVGDSKTLTDQNIRRIAPLLEEKIPHKALLLSPKKYNQVVGEGLRHNAVSVKVALHNQAIFLLLQEVTPPEAIVVDAFTSETNYRKYLKQEANQFTQPLSLIQKAEGQYLAVAVSSIIARNLFLDNLDKLSQELGFRLPSGAGTPSDQVASQILAAYGMAGLGQVAKLHFKNTQKAQALLAKKG